MGPLPAYGSHRPPEIPTEGEPMRRTFVAAALAAAALVAVGCGGSSQQTANDVSQGPGHGADDGSLYRSANLTKALDAMKKEIGDGGQVTAFKLEPASIKSEVKKDGKDQTLIINSKFKPTQVGIGAAVSAPFALKVIKAPVPEKIVESLSSKGVTLKDVNYFLVSDVQGDTSWLVYTNGKGTFQAKLDGSGVKAIGAGAGSTSTADADKQAKQAEEAAKSTAKSAQSLQDCLSKAGTDASAVQKCASGGGAERRTKTAARAPPRGGGRA